MRRFKEEHTSFILKARLNQDPVKNKFSVISRLLRVGVTLVVGESIRVGIGEEVRAGIGVEIKVGDILYY